MSSGFIGNMGADADADTEMELEGEIVPPTQERSVDPDTGMELKRPPGWVVLGSGGGESEVFGNGNGARGTGVGMSGTGNGDEEEEEGEYHSVSIFFLIVCFSSFLAFLPLFFVCFLAQCVLFSLRSSFDFICSAIGLVPRECRVSRASYMFIFVRRSRALAHVAPCVAFASDSGSA